MSDEAHYTPYHPKWYRQPVSVWWWLESWAGTRFVLRELTSVAVGYVALLVLWKARALQQGPVAYGRFLARMQDPIFLVLNTVALVALLYHTITWFNLTPRAMVVRIGGRRLPDWMVQAANYVAWAIVSVLLAWLALRQ